MKTMTCEELKNHSTIYPKHVVIYYDGYQPFALSYYHEGLEEYIDVFFSSEKSALEEYKRLTNSKFGKMIVDAKVCKTTFGFSTPTVYQTLYYL